MKNKNIEMKLIFEDDTIYSSTVIHLPSISKKIVKLKSAYEKLEIGEFDTVVYKELVTVGIAKIQDKYNESLSASIEALGQINSQIKANLLSNTQACLNELKAALNSLLSSNPNSTVAGHPFPLHLITIVDGLPVLSETDKETIKELYCRTYISSDLEFEVHSKLLKFTKAYNDMLETFEKVGYREHFGYDRLNFLFTDSECGKAIDIMPGAVAYAITYDSDYRLGNRFNPFASVTNI